MAFGNAKLVKTSCRQKPVLQEKTICASVRSLKKFITGSVNRNELGLPRVQMFLDKLRVGLFDEQLLASTSSNDQESSWVEVAFVKKELGDILVATRHYAISDQALAPATESNEQQKVEERMKVERRALEADFERRVRQRTEDCDRSRQVAEEQASQVEKELQLLKSQLQDQKTLKKTIEDQALQIRSLEGKITALQEKAKEKEKADQAKLAESRQLQARLVEVTACWRSLLNV